MFWEVLKVIFSQLAVFGALAVALCVIYLTFRFIDKCFNLILSVMNSKKNNLNKSSKSTLAEFGVKVGIILFVLFQFNNFLIDSNYYEYLLSLDSSTSLLYSTIFSLSIVLIVIMAEVKKHKELEFSLLFYFAICIGLMIGMYLNWLFFDGISIQQMCPDTKHAWVGYCGAIIGGALTLSGVAWQVNKSEVQHRKDLAVQYKPAFRFYRKLNEGLYYPMMVNCGRGEAYDIDIASTSERGYFNITNERIPFLAKDEEIYFILVTEPTDLRPEFVHEDIPIVDFVKITYNDAFNNTYRGYIAFKVYKNSGCSPFSFKFVLNTEVDKFYYTDFAGDIQEQWYED